jgi:protein-disulfide isomerase
MKAILCACVAAVTLAAPMPAAAALPGAGAVQTLLRGIPQQGPWLGRPTAPVTLVEYVDLQCPFCATFSAQTLPPLVKAYVRTGRVRILFRGLAFLGRDSTTALRWTFAAGRQNRLWNVLEILFANQGRENAGWVTQSLLTRVARAVPGLDVARLRRDTSRTSAQIANAAEAATAARVPGTPYLAAGTSLLTLKPLTLKSFDAGELAAQLDRLLRR